MRNDPGGSSNHLPCSTMKFKLEKMYQISEPGSDQPFYTMIVTEVGGDFIRGPYWVDGVYQGFGLTPTNFIESAKEVG